MKNQIIQIETLGVVLSIAVATLVLSVTLFTLGKQFNHNQAVNGCLQTSLYRSERIEEIEDTEITITTEEPIKSAVDLCLELKNLK